jgi:hypothetical protein
MKKAQITLSLVDYPSASDPGFLTYSEKNQRPLLLHLLGGEAAFHKDHLPAIKTLAEAHGWKLVIQKSQPDHANP